MGRADALRPGVADGLVASLARPGGNLTGMVFMTSEMMPKRLELLSELVPQAGVIALLVNPNNSIPEPLMQNLQDAARAPPAGEIGSQRTRRWRRESGANPSLKWGFRRLGTTVIPRPLWTIIEAEKGYFGLENGGVSVFAPWQLPPLSGS
jgi:hypothetical protein